LLLLFGFAASYALAVILFFVSDRYRLPIIPLVLIAGSFAVVEGYQHIQTRRWSALLTPALILILLTPIVVLPFWHATYPYQIGQNFTAAQVANSLLMQAQQERLLEKRQRLLRQAMAELERAERRGNPDALYEIYHTKALLELEQGQLEPGMASLQKAYALQPQHIYTITLMGKLYLHQGKLESALAMLQNGIQILPSYPDLYIYSAQVYLKQNQPDKAAQALEAYDLNCPSPNPWVYRMLGDLYFQKGNWAQAADRYRLAIAHPQGREIEPQHYVKWANCFIMLRDYRRSLAIYQDAASRFPHDVQIQNNLRQLRQAVL
jgi:tetratricopeptide (TPR) repeat protein